MAEGTKKGANKIKRAGSRKARIAHYYLTVYPKTKIKRILLSEGFSAAQSWAEKRGFIATFRLMARDLGIAPKGKDETAGAEIAQAT